MKVRGHIFLRNKNYRADIFPDQFINQHRQILHFRTHFLFGIVDGDFIDREQHDRIIIAPDVFPVSYVLVEDIFQLFSAELFNRIIDIEGKNITFVDRFALEKADPFPEQENDNKNDGKACNGAA